jgi:hypothetical protein
MNTESYDIRDLIARVTDVGPPVGKITSSVFTFESPFGLVRGDYYVVLKYLSSEDDELILTQDVTVPRDDEQAAEAALREAVDQLLSAR